MISVIVVYCRFVCFTCRVICTLGNLFVYCVLIICLGLFCGLYLFECAVYWFVFILTVEVGLADCCLLLDVCDAYCVVLCWAGLCCVEIFAAYFVLTDYACLCLVLLACVWWFNVLVIVDYLIVLLYIVILYA